MEATNPQENELRQEGNALVVAANEIAITDPDGYQNAGAFLKKVKAMVGRVAEVFDPIIEQAHRLHKDVLSRKKTFMDPLDNAERTVKRKMGEWSAAEQEKRRKEEDRLRREAIARSQAAQLQAAMDAEERGDEKAVEEILDAKPIVPVVKIDNSDLKVAGVSTTTIWKFRIVNPDALPRAYMMPDEKSIGAVVRRLGAASDIPGVEVYPEESVRVRAG